MTDPSDWAKSIRDLGQRFDPEVAQATRQLCVSYHEQADLADLQVVRDFSYGQDERQRLDVYNAGTSAKPKPIVLFVHGGAFVAGDKTAADGAPFYENVAAWSKTQGFACVAMTYRLAPTHGYPTGSDDVGAAIAWLNREGLSLGLDPSRIILMGQSAGAVHVATYLAKPDLQIISGGGVSGAVLLSGLYDMAVAADNPPKFAYFGKDAALYPERSSLEGLVEHCKIPLLVGVCEFDPPDFQKQALLLLYALFDRDKRLPNTLYLAGHNHLSSIYLLGSSADTLGAPLGEFASGIVTTKTHEGPQNDV